MGSKPATKIPKIAQLDTVQFATRTAMDDDIHLSEAMSKCAMDDDIHLSGL